MTVKLTIVSYSCETCSARNMLKWSPDGSGSLVLVGGNPGAGKSTPFTDSFSNAILIIVFLGLLYVCRML